MGYVGATMTLTDAIKVQQPMKDLGYLKSLSQIVNASNFAFHFSLSALEIVNEYSFCFPFSFEFYRLDLILFPNFI
jgi:hypothetical protein